MLAAFTLSYVMTFTFINCNNVQNFKLVRRHRSFICISIKAKYLKNRVRCGKSLYL